MKTWDEKTQSYVEVTVKYWAGKILAQEATLEEVPYGYKTKVEEYLAGITE